MAALLKLSCGVERTIIFDDEDADFVKLFTWTVTQNGNKLYAKTTKKGLWSEYLHRLILGVQDPSIKVDHENGNGLDCRKHNLRTATQSQNLHNRPTAGLSWNKEKQRWKSRIMVAGKEYFLGYWQSPEYAYAHRRKVIPIMFPHLKDFQFDEPEIEKVLIDWNQRSAS